MRRDPQRGRCLCAALLLVAGLLTLAGPTSGEEHSPAATYTLGPGDVLSISIWGYPELTTDGTVSPDGRITLPLVGAIPATGVSIDALTKDLTHAYASYIIRPQVTVVIKQFRKIRVSLLGQVVHPGSYELQAGTRLLDFIAAAGGLTEAADTRVQLLGPREASMVVDVTRAMAGDFSMNLPLKGGETIVVPEDVVHVVKVEGAVVRPGIYRLKGEMRVLDALLLAGGLTDRASITAATLVRSANEAQSLELDTILLHQDMTRNIVLRPGDILLIPVEANNKIYVLGDVRSPGVFTVTTPITMLQALAMAGGPEQRGVGTSKSVYLVRRHGTQQGIEAGPARVDTLPNGATMITADLPMLMHDPTKDLTVEPGDVVVVPQTAAGGLQLILSILVGVANVLR